MRQLRPSELAAILGELQRQTALEGLNEQRNRWNFLAATVINGASVVSAQVAALGGKRRKPKFVEPDDLMSKDAKKLLQQLLQETVQEAGWSKHIQDAKAKGLQGPWR
ncbi:hypothetical protein [Candidatus Darwinibacter acetoxidans]